MKKLLCILICLPFIGFGQTTLIPDTNFEQFLISMGLDSTLDGSVQTSSIDTVQILDFGWNLNISDLTGIEDFISLVYLKCRSNSVQQSNLTNLNVTNNIALEYLDCSNNLLTSLDVSQNPNLKSLYCTDNQIVSLDLSNNTALINLDCANNQLTSLNLNNNINITDLGVGNVNLNYVDFSMLINLESLWFNSLSVVDVSNNPMLLNLGGGFQNSLLTYVNIQNGNNINLTCDGILPLSCGSFRYHPNLYCIQVDDVAWANTNWINPPPPYSASIDTSFQYFSLNCPPPSKVQEHTTEKELLKVIDLLGRETKQTNQPLLYLYDNGTVEKKLTIE